MGRAKVGGWIALPLAAAAGGIAALLHPISSASIFMVHLAAVAMAAAFAGLTPGIATGVLSILIIDFFFLLPRGSLRLLAEADLLMLLVFGATAALIAWITGRMSREREAARVAARQASAVAQLLERRLDEAEAHTGALQVLNEVRARDRRDPSVN